VVESNTFGVGVLRSSSSQSQSSSIRYPWVERLARMRSQDKGFRDCFMSSHLTHYNNLSSAAQPSDFMLVSCVLGLQDFSMDVSSYHTVIVRGAAWQLSTSKIPCLSATKTTSVETGALTLVPKKAGKITGRVLKSANFEI